MQLHLFFDFDSTIVSKESLDEVIGYALGAHPEKESLQKSVEEITNLGMEGKIDFKESLARRMSVVPLIRSHFEYVGSMLLEHITDGMMPLFQKLTDSKVDVYIISGGFRDSILPVAEKLGVSENHIFTNDVHYDKEGNVTSINTSSICYTNEGKAPVIAHIKETRGLTGKTIMIGDGANDLKAYELGIADNFIGFTANVSRDIMRERAPQTASTTEKLSSLIFKA